MLWFAEGVYTLTFYLSMLTVLAALGAFLDAGFRPAPAYEAAGKLTKPGWLLILGLSVLVLMLMGVVSLIGPFALVAAIVYWVDVRPAVRAVSGGGQGKGRGTGAGPRW